MAHQIEHATMEVFLQELVLPLGGLVGDDLGVEALVGPPLLLRHPTQLLHLLAVLVHPVGGGGGVDFEL